MKILFLCGSLEPGKDGVGDYTRKLAGELLGRGHTICVVAINDKHVNSDLLVPTWKDESQESLATVRLPGSINWQQRFLALQQIVNDFSPDWISLQYVPYSFSIRGLPLVFVHHLSSLRTTARWHIMFHELWIGISNISPIKHKIVGRLQQRIAKKLVTNLRPTIVTTTNKLYQAVLENAGIPAQVLSLFSNIPVACANPHATASIYQLLQVKREQLGQCRLAGTFGNLYPGAKLEDAIREQLQIARDAQKKLMVIAIGRTGKNGGEEIQRLKDIFGDAVTFKVPGELDDCQVSLLLQQLDCGIACTPGQHAGKSGVVAAMRLHNLHIAFPVFDTLPEYDAIVRQQHEHLMHKPAHEWSVAQVAQSFIHLLSAH